MNAMLTDEELERLLEEAAGSFAVPDLELEVPEQRKRVWQRRWPQAGAAAAVVAVASVLLSTFGGGGTTATTKRPLANTALGAAQGQESATLPSMGAPVMSVPAPRALAPSAAQNPTASSTSGEASGVGVQGVGVQDGARIVRTGTIEIAVDKGRVQDAVAQLERLVVGFHGYEADSTSNEVGDNPSASMTMRVPVASFPDVINRIRAMQVQVVSVTQSGKDITATYADTQAQIASLQAARSRYLVILSRAQTIGETLTVQQRVDDVQRQIDQLEGQRRVLADQSDLGTLTVSVTERGASVKPLVAPSRSGWSKAWHDATHGFTSGVQRLIGASGRTLLVLLCGAAVFLLGRAGWRLARRRLL